MRHKIITILISLLISSVLAGEEKRDNTITYSEPDSLTPASATLFLKIATISRAVDFLNSKKEYNNIIKIFFDYNKWIQLIKNRANIDLLNTKSLKEAGIDINRALYLANIEYDNNISEAIFFIPITDKNNFPLNIVKLFKKIAESNNLDLNPAVSTYKDIKVFQIPSKIFFAVVGDYFVLASSGNSLTDIIDLKLKESGTPLSSDPLYADYKRKSVSNNESSIINIFIKKEFLNRTYNAIQEKDAGKDESLIDNSRQETAENKTENDISKDSIDNINNEKTPITQKSKFNFINYVSLGLNNEPDEISLTWTLSANKEDPLGDLLIKAANTGMFEKALFADNPTGYHFISIDINKIINYLIELNNNDVRSNKSYAGLKISPEEKEILKDAVLPCSKSFINIIIKKSNDIGEMDNFVTYIPMKECGEIEATLEKIKDELKKRYTAEDAFGEEKINGYDSFWFKNDNNNKIFVLEYKGDIYTGNDIDFIKTILNTSGKNSLDIQKDFIKRIDRNTFLLSYTQFDDESFLKAILMMLAYNKNPGLYGFMSKIDSLNLIGKRIDNDLTLNLRIKILPAQKKAD